MGFCDDIPLTVDRLGIVLEQGNYLLGHQRLMPHLHPQGSDRLRPNLLDCLDGDSCSK